MMTKPTSEQVTFLAAGSGAVQRTALDKFRDVVSVKDFGAVGDGVADDTAAIQAAIAASTSVVFPSGTYRITSSIEPPSSLRAWHFDNVNMTAAFSGAAILVRGTTDGLAMTGTLSINCQNAANSCGVRLSAVAADPGSSATTSCTFDRIRVINATIGVHFLSDGTLGIYYNSFKTTFCVDCGTGIKLETTSTPRNVNANHFGAAWIQRCNDGIVVDRADFNSFDYAEIESCPGTALKLVRGFGFVMNGGWLEGNGVNIDIADVPDFYSVYVTAAIDDLTPAKFIQNTSAERVVEIKSSTGRALFLGQVGFGERAQFGANGFAANDQGNAADGFGRIRVAASMDFFRISAASPVFGMRCRTGTEGWVFGTQDDGDFFDLRKSRAGFSTPVALFGNAWDTNQLRLGNYYLWVDGTGDLRIKNGAPSSDTDGTVVGTQT